MPNSSEQRGIAYWIGLTLTILLKWSWCHVGLSLVTSLRWTCALVDIKELLIWKQQIAFANLYPENPLLPALMAPWMTTPCRLRCEHSKRWSARSVPPCPQPAMPRWRQGCRCRTSRLLSARGLRPQIRPAVKPTAAVSPVRTHRLPASERELRRANRATGPATRRRRQRWAGSRRTAAAAPRPARPCAAQPPAPRPHRSPAGARSRSSAAPRPAPRPAPHLAGPRTLPPPHLAHQPLPVALAAVGAHGSGRRTAASGSARTGAAFRRAARGERRGLAGPRSWARAASALRRRRAPAPRGRSGPRTAGVTGGSTAARARWGRGALCSSGGLGGSTYPHLSSERSCSVMRPHRQNPPKGTTASKMPKLGNPGTLWGRGIGWMENLRSKQTSKNHKMA